MPFPGKDPTGPTPKTGAKVELTQKEAQRISGEIMKKVENDLGFSINNYPLLEDDPQADGIMVLFEKVLLRITFFKGVSEIWELLLKLAQTSQEALQNVQEVRREPKSRIAICVAFLCHACEHEKVGAAVKSDLRGRPNLKPVIRDIIGFFGGGKFNDPNVETITIDDSYKVVIQLSPNSAKESSNLTIEYSLDW